MDAWDGIIHVTDIVIIKVTNTIAVNVTSRTSIHCHDKKVRYKIDCYIFHTVLSAIMLLLIITIICYLYPNDKSKLKKTYWGADNIKVEKNPSKTVCNKNRTCYYFDDIIKLEDFDFDNVLIDKKSYQNFPINDISYKTLIGPKSLRIRNDKAHGFIRIYDGTTLPDKIFGTN